MRTLVVSLALCALSVVAQAAPQATIKTIDLSTGRDAANTIKAALFDTTGIAPLRVGAFVADYHRDEHVVRGEEDCAESGGPTYALDPTVDLARLLANALTAEAGAMGFRVDATAAPAWTVSGRLKHVYIETDQRGPRGYAPLMFWGFLDVEVTLGSPEGRTDTRRVRVHTLPRNLGGGRREASQLAVAGLLVDGAQEILARLNREFIHAPASKGLDELASALAGRKPAERVEAMLRVGLAGSGRAVAPLLALISSERNEDGRRDLIAAVARIGSSEAATALMARFATEKGDECRWMTIKALDWLGGDEAMAFIGREGPKDADLMIQRLARRIMGVPAVTPATVARLAADWTTRVGYARQELQDVRVGPDLAVAVSRKNTATAIPKGAKVLVREVSLDLETETIELTVVAPDLRRQTRLRFVSDMKTDLETRSEAMWQQVIAAEPIR